MSDHYQPIREQFSALRREKKARHRDIAQTLAISEGELIAAHAGTPAAAAATVSPAATEQLLHATRLRAEWPDIIAAIEELGEVMALTRNESCVHEKTGVYRKVSHNNHVGLVLGGEIDLRIFYQQWAHGFAVSEQASNDQQNSLQFYDASGTAIHKIFMKPQSNLAAYQALVARFAAAEQATGIQPLAAPAKVPELADKDIDVTGFRQAWASLRDTHEFFGLMRKFAVSRTQALRLAETQFVQQVDVSSCQDLLQAAASENVPIMVFTGNTGMIQIHSGPVSKIAKMGPWINVLDPGFNLHLREDHIASAWVVKKPTIDGLVTSLELFDAEGETIAMFFGERKPGKPELCEWRALIDNLLSESLTCAA
ncbi:ChuX/HutX family heme-like substrate-binding protein [Undibacterium sp. TS12]|uniref:hemin-degrading factor n=1 Tax=Undibacterium sp. TS12 TaxID=2908202 RepID=UPI001F4C6C57|nr:ChuX/HutX family heme-like substrate-binding protein [Undibacterium sp. TS12]MCH8622652.1 hemin-degrading factor [Undibacterium sp. TS12]